MDIPVWVIALGSLSVAVLGLVSGMVGSHIARRIDATKVAARVAALEAQVESINKEISALRTFKHDQSGHRIILESLDRRITRLENKLDSL